MRNDTEARWAERVAGWRASGQTSTGYCDGKGFSASGLRYWAHRLDEKAHSEAPVVRLARVERAPSLGAEGPAAPAVPAVAVAEAEPVVLHCGSIQVAVRRGFDQAALAAVLDVLDRRGR